MKDVIGDRFKNQYEKITQTFLPRRNFIVIRLDGKAFHTLTKTMKFQQPFDEDFRAMMTETMKFLCENIQGAILGYTQSDEISIVLQDFKNKETDAWFNGNVQKIVSISASLATVKFNEKLKEYISNAPDILRPANHHKFKGAYALFDSRCFTISRDFEVYNYLLWRQKDCIRNSILSLAQHELGKKKIKGLNCQKLKKQLMTEKNILWDEMFPQFKYGYFCQKKKIQFFSKEQDTGSYLRQKWVYKPAYDLLNNENNIRDEIFKLLSLED